MSGLSPIQQNATTKRHVLAGVVAGLIIFLADQAVNTGFSISTTA